VSRHLIFPRQNFHFYLGRYYLLSSTPFFFRLNCLVLCFMFNHAYSAAGTLTEDFHTRPLYRESGCSTYYVTGNRGIIPWTGTFYATYRNIPYDFVNILFNFVQHIPNFIHPPFYLNCRCKFENAIDMQPQSINKIRDIVNKIEQNYQVCCDLNDKFRSERGGCYMSAAHPFEI